MFPERRDERPRAVMAAESGLTAAGPRYPEGCFFPFRPTQGGVREDARIARGRHFGPTICQLPSASWSGVV